MTEPYYPIAFETLEAFLASTAAAKMHGLDQAQITADLDNLSTRLYTYTLVSEKELAELSARESLHKTVIGDDALALRIGDTLFVVKDTHSITEAKNAYTLDDMRRLGMALRGMRQHDFIASARKTRSGAEAVKRLLPYLQADQLAAGLSALKPNDVPSKDLLRGLKLTHMVSSFFDDILNPTQALDKKPGNLLKRIDIFEKAVNDYFSDFFFDTQLDPAKDREDRMILQTFCTAAPQEALKILRSETPFVITAEQHLQDNLRGYTEIRILQSLMTDELERIAHMPQPRKPNIHAFPGKGGPAKQSLAGNTDPANLVILQRSGKPRGYKPHTL